MKKIAIILSIVIIIISCKKEDPAIIRHDVMIRGTASLTANKSSHLTPKEISKQASYIVYRLKDNGWNVGKNFVYTEQRDTVNGILKRYASDILDPSNYALDSTFITGKDMVLERYLNGWTRENGINWPYIDTIGYIPNSVLKNAYDLIMPAFKNHRWQEIYDIFNEKFVFLPITGPEYRELVKSGLN